MLRDFLSSIDTDELNNLPFGEAANNLADSLISSLVIGAHADLSVEFGLDLNPVFNSEANFTDRLPTPFLQINQFDLSANFGVNEWSADLPLTLGGTEFSVLITEAQILCEISVQIPDEESPLVIASPGDFLALVRPSTTVIDIAASLSVDIPIFVLSNGVGVGARIGYYDDNLLDKVFGDVTLDADLLFELQFVQQAALVLQENTAFLSDIDPFFEEIPLLKTTVNELIAGENRTLASLFDLRDWANNLEGSPVGRRALEESEPVISLSELKNEVRAALLATFTPNSLPDQPPSIPDAAVFNVVREIGSICAANDRAISVGIEEGPGLVLSLCALLEFELDGEFDAAGLLDAVEDLNLQLDVSGEFKLRGALTLGARLSVSPGDNNAINVGLDFDPITVEVLLDGGMDASASFGMIEAFGSADATLGGLFQLIHCPDCNGERENFERIGNSSFYYDGQVGYELAGSLGLGAAVPGVEVESGLTVAIRDVDVFDDLPPEFTPPDVDALKDSLKLTPANALRMLKIVDG